MCSEQNTTQQYSTSKQTNGKTVGNYEKYCVPNSGSHSFQRRRQQQRQQQWKHKNNDITNNKGYHTKNKEQRTTKHITIMATFTTPTQQYIRQWHILTIQRPLVCRCNLTVKFDWTFRGNMTGI